MDQVANDPPDFVAALEEWIESYSEGKEMYAILFSDALERFEERMWPEYRRLESHRSALSVPRRDWQMSLEASREQYQSFKRAWYSPWTKRLMHFFPLSVCLGWKKDSIHEHRRAEYPWHVTLSNWSLFNECYNHFPEFRQTLSSSQLSSYGLLRDWWEARYCDGSLVENSKAFMDWQSQCRWTEIWYLEGKRLDKEFGDLNNSGPNQPRYEHRCFRLFISEFHPDYWQPLTAKSMLEPLVGLRRSTTQCAIAQRFSYPMLSNIKEVMSRKDIHAGYPKLSLAPITASQGRPYYLWDTSECRTIETHQFANELDYACISHTWGRWVDKSKEPFQIPGVPWPVPRIRPERFDVSELPQQVKKLGHRYIWLDLVCIPQVPNEPWSSKHSRQTLDEWKGKADDEIARQSTIFHGSSKCVAWVNDVVSWTTTKLALEWMGVKFLEHAGYTNIDQPLDNIEKLGFVLDQSNRRAAEPPINIGWLSSLWTLQEAVLCPDMELLDANWLTLTDTWGHAVSIRTLMVLINQCQPDKTSAWPEVPTELAQLNDLTNLSAIFLSESPAVICSVTNLRVCSGPPESRAAAIMSALGVTDWWQTRETPIINKFGE